MDIVFQASQNVFNYRVAGIWIEDGHVLIHKNIHDTHWSLPGGRVKMLEDSKEGLKREFVEELDIQIEVENIIWTTENFFQYDGRNYHEIGFYYQVTSTRQLEISTEPFVSAEKGNSMMYQWMPIPKLSEIQLEPSFLQKGLPNLPIHPRHFIQRS